MLIYILFIVGFFLLIKGADCLVDGAVSIAKKLKIPSIVVGLTIVAFGTSSPELIVNIFASCSGNTEIAIGNILGSNTSNILLILGLSAIVYPLVTKKNTIWKEIPLSLLAAILLGIMASDTLIDGSSFSGLTRIDGLILLSFFVIFFYYIIEISKNGQEDFNLDIKQLGYLRSILYIIGGLFCLVLGGKWIVDGAIKIAEVCNVNQSLIGLTIVAVGTSLPELATSVVAAYKKQTDIAVGNIVGSNIFNIFFILGISAIIRPLPFMENFRIDIFMTIFASLLLFIVMFVGKKHIIERWQGTFMIFVYVMYVVFLIIRK